jgi:hypothetical protein
MPDIKNYQKFLPSFDIRQILNGNMRATGIFQDSFGRQQRQFHASLHGQWQGNIGELHEEFIFNDGERQTRHWQINVLDDHRFTATAGDVKGIAQGQQYGNAVNMRYQLVLLLQEIRLSVDMDDWMYLMDDRTIINRTIMRKLGIKLGELTLVIQKC